MKCVVALLLLVSTSAFASGVVQCKSLDGSISLTGTVNGSSVNVTSAVVDGTDLLKAGDQVGLVDVTDSSFDAVIVDPKTGVSALSIITTSYYNMTLGGYDAKGTADASGKAVQTMGCAYTL